MKRMLSGIKPTGRVTLGNYIGAIKPFVSYQDEYEMIVFVANLHSMTIYQEPKDLRKNTKDLISLYLAAGLDPKKVTLFLQSDVLEHAQLGWYLGCMVSMGELSRMTQYKDKASKLKKDEYEMIVFVANLHSMTIYQEPKDLRKNTKDLISLYLAAGLDPKKVTLFLQSDVLEHAQLGWYLGCMVSMGELSRMTQYKDKASKLKKDESIGAGIFNYPSLMNADILIYDPDYVPVGEDQKQHCELARDIAERFNNRYSETFKLPEPLVPKVGGRIMDLQNPTKKMSKSDETGKGCIYILDDINVSKKKIMSAVTDSDNAIYYDVKNKPGISNLLTIYSILSGESIDALVERYQGVGYGQFKKDLAEIVGNELQKIHDKYNEINQGNYIDTILNEGADKARYMARKKLAKVERKIGITIKK